MNISIHALRMEGDLGVLTALLRIVISIHALRMEGDQPRQHEKLDTKDFNPRPPHGGRLLPCER